MPNFELGHNVHENVRALRRALGSAVRELSRADLAKMISARHSDRRIGGSTVERWELDVEPDYESVGIMAALAGVSFADFAVPPGHADRAALEAMKAAQRHPRRVDPSDVPTRRPKRSPVSPPVDRKKGA